MLGIFAEFDAANLAIGHLPSVPDRGADAVLVSRSAHWAAGMAQPFDTLWAGTRTADGTAPRIEGQPRTSWLEHNLAQHLANRASIVVVKTNDPEQQLAISRALLDLGCDVLLTHDVTAPISGTDGNHVHNPVIFR